MSKKNRNKYRVSGGASRHLSENKSESSNKSEKIQKAVAPDGNDGGPSGLAKKLVNLAPLASVVVGLISALIAAYSAFVSTKSAVVATDNAQISRQNYDRLAGNVRAKFLIEKILPEQNDVPVGLLGHSDIFGFSVLTMNEPDDFFRLNPRIVIKNTGHEPIGEVRLESRLGFSFIDLRDAPLEEQKRPTPWAFEDAKIEDYVLSEKLMPGKSVAISLTKVLLSQIVQLQASDRGDRWHYGRFEIRCMARLVNAGAFDATEDEGGYRVNFRWKSENFPSDKCNAILEKLKHAPIVLADPKKE